MDAATVAGFALWMTYGVLIEKWPPIVTNAVCMLPAGKRGRSQDFDPKS